VIRVQNVYYMLAYAFQILNSQGYKNIATEKFDNTGELMAAILIKGSENLIKRGLGKEYIPQREETSSLRGKIDIAASVKRQTLLRRQMVCHYDDFSVNSYMNRIIKSTMLALLSSNLSKERKKALRKLLVFFNDVELIDLLAVQWNLRYDRNNQSYRMLISICFLISKGLLQTQTNGKTKLMDFLDEQRMHRLYEKFILAYYRREFPQINANPSQIAWQIDNEVRDMLPTMQTDIMLEHGEKTLIIDAKYYSRTTQQQYGVHTLHSGNLYQIFTYVKNKEVELSGKPHAVSGMLLYAKTDEEIIPDREYRMSGNKIAVRTLDLDQDFSKIKMQLDRIVTDYLKDSLIE